MSAEDALLSLRTESAALRSDTPNAPRLLSLDAFRGLVIALMFLVNLSGSRAAFPEWFGHAGWNTGHHGQWLADFVFPWFLFIVGCAIPFSMAGGRGRDQAPGQRMLGALRRGVIIYFLGVLIMFARTSSDRLRWIGPGGDLASFAPELGRPITWSSLLYWDILPLIALGYVLAVILWHAPKWLQLGFVLLVLIGKFVAMPDMSAQAGLADRAAWMASRFDFEHGTRALGWFGTAITQGLPATVCVVLGMWCGQLLFDVSRRSPAEKAAAKPARAQWLLIGGGLACTAMALLLAGPIGNRFSKDFLTSSYVLLCCGSAAAILGLLYFAIDRAGALRRSAWLLGVLGGNALVIYILSEMIWAMVLTRWRITAPDGSAQTIFNGVQAHWSSLVGPVAGPWLATLTVIMCYWLLSYFMMRKKIVIKV